MQNNTEPSAEIIKKALAGSHRSHLYFTKPNSIFQGVSSQYTDLFKAKAQQQILSVTDLETNFVFTVQDKAVFDYCWENQLIQEALSTLRLSDSPTSATPYNNCHYIACLNRIEGYIYEKKGDTTKANEFYQYQTADQITQLIPPGPSAGGIS